MHTENVHTEPSIDTKIYTTGMVDIVSGMLFHNIL